MKFKLSFFLAFVFLFLPSGVFAADLIATSAGDSFLNQTYLDQLDGTWEGENMDYKICTYDGTYAIITAIADVCGSGSSQWYHNFGSSFDSADIAALSPGDWTNNFFTDPAPAFEEGEPAEPIYGCTDPLATNYDPVANTDDDSCVYPEIATTSVPYLCEGGDVSQVTCVTYYDWLYVNLWILFCVSFLPIGFVFSLLKRNNNISEKLNL